MAGTERMVTMQITHIILMNCACCAVTHAVRARINVETTGQRSLVLHKCDTTHVSEGLSVKIASLMSKPWRWLKVTGASSRAGSLLLKKMTGYFCIGSKNKSDYLPSDWKQTLFAWYVHDWFAHAVNKLARERKRNKKYRQEGKVWVGFRAELLL